MVQSTDILVNRDAAERARYSPFKTDVMGMVVKRQAIAATR